MINVKEVDFQKDMESYLKQITEHGETIQVIRENGRNIVIMSMEEYNRLIGNAIQAPASVNADLMSREELDAALQKGYDDIQAGADSVFEKFREKHSDEAQRSEGDAMDGMQLNRFGKDSGSVILNPIPIRGISEVVVNYKKADEVDFDQLKQKLCQSCLDQVVKIYVDQKNLGMDSHVATTGYCLIDFQTKQLYTLSEPYTMYFIRDYHVDYEIKEDNGGAGDRIEIQIFYAPERDS